MKFIKFEVGETGTYFYKKDRYFVYDLKKRPVFCKVHTATQLVVEGEKDIVICPNCPEDDNIPYLGESS